MYVGYCVDGIVVQLCCVGLVFGFGQIVMYCIDDMVKVVVVQMFVVILVCYDYYMIGQFGMFQYLQDDLCGFVFVVIFFDWFV